MIPEGNVLIGEELQMVKKVIGWLNSVFSTASRSSVR